MERHGIQFLILWLAVCISVGYARAPKKILGGMNAVDAEFPYQVSIQKFNGHWCGGSILDATHILTAAHCVIADVSRPQILQVITGTIWTNRRQSDNVFAVSQVIPNNYYSHGVNRTTGVSYYADIAVLKLARPILFSNLQMPIELPDSDTPPDAPVVSTGWGTSHYDENGVEKSVTWLQKLQTKTISLAECQKYYPKWVAVGHICIISADGYGTCNGDSGGPLAYNNTLVGIVSWKTLCARGLPDVFTNVYDYLDWIRWAMQS